MCVNYEFWNKMLLYVLQNFTLNKIASSFQASVPVPYVKEMKDAGQFYTNRVLKDWKEK